MGKLDCRHSAEIYYSPFAIRHSPIRRQQVQICLSPPVSGLPLFVGVRFQVYFTPLAGVLFTFPSRY